MNTLDKIGIFDFVSGLEVIDQPDCKYYKWGPFFFMHYIAIHTHVRECWASLSRILSSRGKENRYFHIEKAGAYSVSNPLLLAPCTTEGVIYAMHRSFCPETPDYLHSSHAFYLYFVAINEDAVGRIIRDIDSQDPFFMPGSMQTMNNQDFSQIARDPECIWNIHPERFAKSKHSGS